MVRSREGPVDIVKWFSLTTFDIISDLAFGQPEGCLDNADQPWLSVMGARAKSIVWYQLSIYYRAEWLLKWIAPKSLTAARQQHMQMLAAKVQRRLKESSHTKDFMSYILDNKTEKLTNAELVVMASAFLVAGSGTSARALSATIFYLATNPVKLQKAIGEVRNTFQEAEAITIRSTSQLRYLQACIDEAMRLHPPQPGGLPRFVPGVGEEIEGKFVPGGTAVGVHQLSSGQADWNFSRAKEFIPERWLEQSPPSEFAGDDRGSRQPFSYGPRNCIGMNLAYAEMLLIMAKLLFAFDIEQDEGMNDWTSRQKIYLTWEQIPLLVRLSVRG
ncbi:hypothetical protein PRZ48_014158 [Zasmidium cellare]|uniref:Cytochrome P450 n=1 Tax=Zasmidium cellare TaxID=395010 RepID=A0ABR0E052_ZASCE|nr:hypothetical protein PRZ48_014158 [Zasmidium cellare]